MELPVYTSYQPRWFMQEMHVNPKEALRIHRDIGARFSVGIHWGTFQLTDEAPLQPRRDLHLERAKQGLDENVFTTLAIGETAVFPPRTPDTAKGQGKKI